MTKKMVPMVGLSEGWDTGGGSSNFSRSEIQILGDLQHGGGGL